MRIHTLKQYLAWEGSRNRTYDTDHNYIMERGGQYRLFTLEEEDEFWLATHLPEAQKRMKWHVDQDTRDAQGECGKSIIQRIINEHLTGLEQICAQRAHDDWLADYDEDLG